MELPVPTHTTPKVKLFSKQTLEEYIRNAEMNVFVKRRMMIALADSPTHPLVPQIHSASKHQISEEVYEGIGELISERYHN